MTLYILEIFDFTSWFIQIPMHTYWMSVYIYTCIDYVACIMCVNICTMIEGLGVRIAPANRATFSK